MLKELNTEALLKTALKQGGDYAELYFENTRSSQILAEQGRIEKIFGGVDQGLGIRVLAAGKTAYGYTTDLSTANLQELASTVAAAISGQKHNLDITLKALPATVNHTIEDVPAQHQLEDKIQLVKTADKHAWQQDPRIKQVKVVYGDMSKWVQIANSCGELIEDERIYTLMFCQAIAQNDQGMQTGYYPAGGLIGMELFKNESPEHIGQEAGKQAILMLGARPSPAGTMTVVISGEAGGTMVHEAVGHGLEADLACENLSVYSNRIGDQVATSKISVLDDATIPQKRGSFTFDDEGVPAQRSVLIENGILKNYMYDRRYALENNTESTGNGRRESFRHRPICRMTNTMIAPGTDNPKEIISNTESGLYVRKMGGGQVDTVNGSFVFEVNEAYMIEKGQIGEPVRGAVLTGTGPAVMQSIDRVGDDPGFSLGTCGKENQGVPVGDAQPTIRIPELTVGGAA